MDQQKYKVQLTLTGPLLGTCPKNKDLYKTWVASKAEDPEGEAANVQENLEDKGWTGFLKDENGYFIFSYMVKGFLCESARTMKEFGAMKQLADKFKRYVFVTPTKIRLPEIEAEPLERSLRAQTAQGPRICLTRSDVIAAGSILEFELTVLEAKGVNITENCLREVLAYGKFMGLGQWRSSSVYGTFEVTELTEM